MNKYLKNPAIQFLILVLGGSLIKGVFKAPEWN